MAGVYLDTSAVGRVLLAEPDAPAIRDALAMYESWWSSELLIVELRRLAAREDLLTAAEQLLSGISLAPVDRASLERAAAIEPSAVRSLDAIHLDAAVRLRDKGTIDVLMTYDRQLQSGCRMHSLAVSAPPSP